MYLIRETILRVFNLDGSLYWFYRVVGEKTSKLGGERPEGRSPFTLPRKGCPQVFIAPNLLVLSPTTLISHWAVNIASLDIAQYVICVETCGVFHLFFC
jgi:hypothetical protein